MKESLLPLTSRATHDATLDSTMVPCGYDIVIDSTRIASRIIILEYRGSRTQSVSDRGPLWVESTSPKLDVAR